MTPSHGEFVNTATAYAVIAPKTSVPSRPRLMRPERSVIASPRDTKMNGVETRMAPPSTASGTPQRPISTGSMSRVPFPKVGIEHLEPAVEGLAEEDDDEQHALQQEHGCVGQIHTTLDQPA